MTSSNPIPLLQLSKNGFNAIDAVDGSEAMLAKLKQKGVYRQATKVMIILF